MSLPPGFRFHPTDEELIGYYLKRKVDGLKIELEVIPEVDLYKFDPWDLPDKSFLTKKDMERFFFCPRDRKYPNGSRTNRATAAGYWKATGKDRKIVCQTSVTGMKKTLVFYRRRAPAGDRTVWVMHEYRLCEELTQGTYSFHGAFALCRVVKRNEQDHKMGEFHGKPRNQKIVSSSLLNDFTPRAFCDHIARIPEECPSPTIYTTNGNHDKAPIPTSQSQTIMEKNLEATPAKVNDSVISDKVIVEAQYTASECLLPNELPSTISIWQPFLNPAVSVHHSSYTSLNQDIDLANDFTAFDYVSPYLRPRIDFEMKLNETVDLPSPEWIEYSCPDQLTNAEMTF